MTSNEVDAALKIIRDDAIANNRPYNVYLFDASQFDNIVKKATNGHGLACRILTSFAQWGEHADKDNAGCFSCGERIHPGTVSAIAFLEPADKLGFGLIAVQCDDCYDKMTADETLDRLVTSLKQDLNCDATAFRIQ